MENFAIVASAAVFAVAVLVVVFWLLRLDIKERNF
jgi:hypothetical protein